MNILKKTLAVVLLSLGTISAHATPITWTLAGVTFDDGGTAAGSFVFDADTSSYTDVDITTTAGFASPGTQFDTADLSSGILGNSSEDRLLLHDIFTNFILAFEFASPLTNAGGAIEIATLGLSYEGAELFNTFNECFGPFCGGLAPTRAVTDGRIASATVPAPLTLGLFGLGLLGLGFSRRQKA